MVPTSTGMLFGEVRDAATKEVSFFCLDRENGKVRWEGKKFGEGWWIGIEAVHGTMAFLHGFNKPDLPAHRGIIAVDLSDGRAVWARPELSFLAITPPALLAVDQGPVGRKVLELELLTGRETRLWNEGEEPLPPSPQAQDPEIEFPRSFTAAEAAKPGLSVRLATCLAPPLPADAEVIERGDRLVVHHLSAPPGDAPADRPRQTLLSILAPSSGQILYQDVVSSDAERLMPDGFFMTRTMVYYVQNRSTLVAVKTP